MISSAGSSLITLSTDFGHVDPFVGQMKGALLGINPKAVIIDITHGITRFDIREACLVIGDSYRYFPPGSVHVAVVDPGVGSKRRPLILKADGRLFVGPDNGVFTAVIRANPDYEAVHITAEEYFIGDSGAAGATFHGRDVFAPVAAWLSLGKKPGEFGPPLTDPVLIRLPSPVVERNAITGEVIHVDTFGNCITNIGPEHLETLAGRGTVTVRIKNTDMDVLHHYAQARDDRPHALINSSGRLEIFVNQGEASASLALEAGEKVTVFSGRETE